MVTSGPGAPRTAPARVDVSVVVRLNPADVWDVLWRRTLQERWLGPGSRVPLGQGRRLVLADEAGPWQSGRVKTVDIGTRVVMELAGATGWSTGGTDTVTVSIKATPWLKGAVPTGEIASTVRIVDVGPHAVPNQEEIQQFWRAALARLATTVERVRARRDSPRQAVIVIHGIGEQLPGATLRQLADSGVVGRPDVGAWIKPDRMSNSFELRRITFSATENRQAPTTDLYELYWANLIRDTTVGQLGGWLRGLLLRRRVPAPIRPVWLLAWAVILAVLAGLIVESFGLVALPRWLAAGGVTAILATALWKLVARPVAVNFLGDAARYLSPRPDNIAHRQAIRTAGVDLIERLHTSGRYDRIVILGHSLGSVIAYDIVTYSWIRMCASHRRPAKPDFTPLRAVERQVTTVTDPVAAQAAQHAAWTQTRKNTQPWLVSDLITVGSPLTYADFLMAGTDEEFTKAQADRILPTCPPVTSLEAKSGHQRCTRETAYEGDAARSSRPSFTSFDHAALFGVVRWTNLYFTVRWLGLVGDLVGGPLAGQFGPWVRDIPMPSPVRRFAHTLYWRPVKGHDAHLTALHEALRLEAGAELLNLGAGMPAFVIAEGVGATDQ